VGEGKMKDDYQRRQEHETIVGVLRNILEEKVRQIYNTYDSMGIGRAVELAGEQYARKIYIKMAEEEDLDPEIAEEEFDSQLLLIEGMEMDWMDEDAEED
jgi:hypothetical protein